MNNLELKGGILELIAKINDRETLTELRKIVTEFMGNNLKDEDYWDELSDTEKGELNEAIKESDDESNLVNHSKVMEKYKQWLSK